MDKKELTQIVKAVQKDKGQFELLYSQIAKKVYYWCFTIIGKEADALDAMQESMIRILDNIDDLKEPEAFNSWMYRLVRNRCLMYIRKYKKNDFEFPQNDEYNESFETRIREERREHIPSEAYDLNETKKLIVTFINKLPTRQREVITLFYLEELKINEIAEILNYNVGSVKSRLHAGRKNLETQINEYQEENNVRLYAIVLLPLLGLILQEAREEVCGRQDLSYDTDMYASKSSKYSKFLSSHAGLIATIVGLLVLMIILSFMLLYPSDDNNHQQGLISSQLIDNNDEYNKTKQDLYIEHISYITFPQRDSLDIEIELKPSMNNKGVKILFDNKEIDNNREDNRVLFTVHENGTYSLMIDNEVILFSVDNIDQYAPEVTGIQNYNNYLQLTVNDELSQIDYDNSYLEYKGEKFNISKDLRVYGNFEEMVSIIIFNKDGLYIGYDLFLK